MFGITTQFTSTKGASNNNFKGVVNNNQVVQHDQDLKKKHGQGHVLK